jgi:hypothetical protein
MFAGATKRESLAGATGFLSINSHSISGSAASVNHYNARLIDFSLLGFPIGDSSIHTNDPFGVYDPNRERWIASGDTYSSRIPLGGFYQFTFIDRDLLNRTLIQMRFAKERATNRNFHHLGPFYWIDIQTGFRISYPKRT